MKVQKCMEVSLWGSVTLSHLRSSRVQWTSMCKCYMVPFNEFATFPFHFTLFVAACPPFFLWREGIYYYYIIIYFISFIYYIILCYRVVEFYTACLTWRSHAWQGRLFLVQNSLSLNREREPASCSTMVGENRQLLTDEPVEFEK